jgi:hypothetical protein
MYLRNLWEDDCSILADNLLGRDKNAEDSEHYAEDEAVDAGATGVRWK